MQDLTVKMKRSVITIRQPDKPDAVYDFSNWLTDYLQIDWFHSLNQVHGNEKTQKLSLLDNRLLKCNYCKTRNVFLNITIWQWFNLEILLEESGEGGGGGPYVFIWWLLILAKFSNLPISPNKSIPIIYRFTVANYWTLLFVSVY